MDFQPGIRTRPLMAARLAAPSRNPVIIQPRFGWCSNSKAISNEKAVFETYIPRPVKFFQRGMAELNRFVFFNTWLPIPGLYRNEFRFADPQSLKNLTQAIPKDAGVLMVGSHPDRKDANLLCEMYRQADQYPASVLISSEMIQKFGSFIHPCLIKIVKPIFSMMGMIPLNRGARNPHVRDYTVRSISEGKWSSVFPEGDVRVGPRVFAMQKGAVEMAMQAAIKSNFKRPILVVPFAHTWTYRDPEKAEKAFLKSMESLEDHVMKKRRGKLQDLYPGDKMQDRVLRVGNQVMDCKLKEYSLHPPKNWDDMDFFRKAEYIRNQGIALLEKKYGLKTEPDTIEHKRLMKIRSAAWEQLAQLPESRRKKNLKSFDDIKCSQELAYLSLFNPADLKDYGNGKTMDKEMLATYALQLSSLMGLSGKPLCSRVGTVKVLEPIDIRKQAKVYQSLKTPQQKLEYTIQQTEELFQVPIQREINALRKQSIRWK